MIELLESTAFGAALVFGFRHGFDWDHIAALTDLTGSQAAPRRSMGLATLYAVGHGVMVILLGLAAILFAERVPDSVDVAMERLVGVSLLLLGLWIAWTAIKTRGAPPLRSRWMLIVSGIRRLVDGRRRRDGRIVIEHSHAHDHRNPMHDHPHLRAGPTEPEIEHRAATAVVVGHTHLHRHVAVAPTDPFVSYGSWSAFGVGMLHGIGAETPTQLLVFAAATQTSGRPTSVALLLCFVIGLLAANTMVAAASTLGFRSVLRKPAVAVGLAAVTAVFSLVIGSLLLLGHSASLPVLFAG